jgi:starch synthase
MIAMGYGTLPIVRETGGLQDSVIPYNQYTGEGTGFRFSQASADDLKNCVLAVTQLYRDEPDTWKQLQAQAMAQDFGWKTSAAEYLSVYQQLLS